MLAAGFPAFVAPCDSGTALSHCMLTDSGNSLRQQWLPSLVRQLHPSIVVICPRHVSAWWSIIGRSSALPAAVTVKGGFEASCSSSFGSVILTALVVLCILTLIACFNWIAALNALFYFVVALLARLTLPTALAVKAAVKAAVKVAGSETRQAKLMSAFTSGNYTGSTPSYSFTSAALQLQPSSTNLKKSACDLVYYRVTWRMVYATVWACLMHHSAVQVRAARTMAVSRWSSIGEFNLFMGRLGWPEWQVRIRLMGSRHVCLVRGSSQVYKWIRSLRPFLSCHHTCYLLVRRALTLGLRGRGGRVVLEDAARLLLFRRIVNHSVDSQRKRILKRPLIGTFKKSDFLASAAATRAASNSQIIDLNSVIKEISRYQHSWWAV